MRRREAALAAVCAVGLSGAASAADLRARVVTSQGVFEMALFPAEAPAVVFNFVTLARQGFYDGTRFHRLLPGHSLVGGAPKGKSGGGPGYCFTGEAPGERRHLKAGAVSMVGTSLRAFGSQFEVTLAPAPDLDGRSPVFGEVDAGLDVLSRLAAAAPNDRGIEHVEIVGDAAPVAVEKTPELDSEALAKLLGPGVQTLAAAIGKALGLGRLKAVTLETSRSRCAASQAAFRADYAKGKGGRLLVYARAGDDKAVIRQFQFERPTP